MLKSSISNYLAVRMYNQIASENKISYNTICIQILSLDSSIRFAGFCNNMGTRFAAEYRNGIIPLLTERESKLSFMGSVLRMTTYDTQPKLGKPVYSFTVYKNVRRTTILIDNKDYPVRLVSNPIILMVSFDNIGKVKIRVHNTAMSITISLLSFIHPLIRPMKA